MYLYVVYGSECDCNWLTYRLVGRLIHIMWRYTLSVIMPRYVHILTSSSCTLVYSVGIHIGEHNVVCKRNIIMFYISSTISMGGTSKTLLIGLFQLSMQLMRYKGTYSTFLLIF